MDWLLKNFVEEKRMSAWSGRFRRASTQGSGHKKPGARNLGPVIDFTQSRVGGTSGSSYNPHTLRFLQSADVV
ncbi:hypothetical protein [Variovorax sp. TBS-050B]|uniref:hypothetical protein n=1 Tax=Variovorax sp. TBS-050B TaxID=2940551 RepID=UPI002475408A|nr:hypothetical protein [Variovorax sp. TBS-050B]